MKILPVGAELFNADGQTNMTKPVVAFHNFVNARLRNCSLCPHSDFVCWLWPLQETVYLN